MEKAGHVLVVADVLADGDEGNRDEDEGGLGDRGSRKRGDRFALRAKEEEEFRVVDEGLDADVGEKGHKRAEVDDLEVLVLAGVVAKEGEEDRGEVAGAHADEEGDEGNRLLAIVGADGGDDHRDDAADDADPVVIVRGDGGVGEVVDGAASEAKADDHDDRADHDGWEELVQPLDAEDLDEEGDEAIDEANHRHADGEDPEVHLAGRQIVDRDRRAHGAHVGEARREEHRGFEFRDEEVEEGADARGEEGRGDHDGGEIHGLPAKDDAVLPEVDHRDGDAGDEHREHVLNRENDRLRFLLHQ